MKHISGHCLILQLCPEDDCQQLQSQTDCQSEIQSKQAGSETSHHPNQLDNTQQSVSQDWVGG